MVIWTVYAEVKDEVIRNIIVSDDYTEANLLAIDTYGEGAYAIEVTHYPVMIGDRCVNGIFYRGEDVISPIPTAEEELVTTNANVAANSAAIDDIVIAMLGE